MRKAVDLRSMTDLGALLAGVYERAECLVRTASHLQAVVGVTWCCVLRVVLVGDRTQKRNNTKNARSAVTRRLTESKTQSNKQETIVKLHGIARGGASPKRDTGL